MIIYLNNQPIKFDPDFTLFEILKQEGIQEKRGIAVAVNEEVISKSSWSEYKLQNSDKITLITATQGG